MRCEHKAEKLSGWEKRRRKKSLCSYIWGMVWLFPCIHISTHATENMMNVNEILPTFVLHSHKLLPNMTVLFINAWWSFWRLFYSCLRLILISDAIMLFAGWKVFFESNISYKLIRCLINTRILTAIRIIHWQIYHN